MATATETERPAWLNEVLGNFTSGVAHVQMISGGIFDYVVPPLNVRQYLDRTLMGASDLIVHYSIDEGITFVTPSMRLRFQGALGLTELEIEQLPTAAQPALAMLLRLAAVYGQRAPDDPSERAATEVAVVMVDRLDLILPPADKAHMDEARLAMLGALHRAGTDDQLSQSGNLILLLAPSLEEVHPDLRLMSSGLRATEIPLPDLDRRLSFIQKRTEREQDAWTLAMPAWQFAALTAGLYLRGIDDIGMRAEGQPITVEHVEKLTADIIREESGGLLEVVKPRGGFDMIGGNAKFKAWAGEWLLDAWHSEDAERRVSVPLSLLLIGPPGTAKSTIAEALAFELGLPLLVRKSVKDSLVGASERNDAKAERVTRAKLPAVIFRDEIDQDVGRVTGGTGAGAESIDKALFKSQLKFMEDTSLRGLALHVGASNRPDQIDDALMSRFEVRVPILPPESDAARADILSRLLARHGVPGIKDKLLLPAAAMMKDWSGRDMDQAVVKARGLMRLHKLSPLEAVERAASTRRPLLRADAELMTRLAVAECNDLELLPNQYQQQPIDRKELDEEIAQVRERGRRTLDV